MTKHIIGAGLSGLITAYYLKDYYLIDKKENIGGQFNHSFLLGPRFVKYNEEFKRLLKELGIKYTIKKARVGYSYKDSIYSKLTSKMKKEYCSKTRNSKDEKSFMCDKNNTFCYLDFDFKIFIDTIFSKIKDRFIDGYISTISIYKNHIYLNCGNYTIDSEKVISTIHYKNFCKLVNKKYVSQNKDIYFYCCERNESDTNKFDFIYYIDKNTPINRITYTKKFIIVEATRNIKIINRKVIDKYVLTDYKLSSKNKIKEFKNIKFLGRYATLDNSKRINNIFEEIKNAKKC